MSLHLLKTNSFTNSNTTFPLISKFFKKSHSHHSWLIYGNQGIGKASSIYKLINELLSNTANTVYGEKDYYHPDLLVIDKLPEKKEISVDSIRKINNFLSLTPLQSQFRIVLIDNCNYLNTNAANALLKILEEPPKNSLIFLISHAIGQLPFTITSRCIKLHIHNPTYTSSIQILLSLLEDINENYAKKLITLSCTSIGLAIELHNNNALDDYQEFIGLLNNIRDISIKQIWKWLDNVEDWKYISMFCHHFTAKLLKTASNLENLYYINDEERKLIYSLCSKCDISILIELYESIQYLLKECTIANLEHKQVILAIFNKFRNITLLNDQPI
ncbi:DNA polymerase III subunit tau [Rickettsiales bacterium Ac37b]|nr:DNA polymerase III subunit tau [Rickettsiales bacterium Ac37b]